MVSEALDSIGSIFAHGVINLVIFPPTSVVIADQLTFPERFRVVQNLTNACSKQPTLVSATAWHIVPALRLALTQFQYSLDAHRALCFDKWEARLCISRQNCLETAIYSCCIFCLSLWGFL